MNLLEFCVRKDMEESAPRGMGVLQPLKVVLTNFPEDQSIELRARGTQNESLGQRTLPFGRELYIERADFELGAAEEVQAPVARRNGALTLCLYYPLR